jgi:hypothetical protein
VRAARFHWEVLVVNETTELQDETAAPEFDAGLEATDELEDAPLDTEPLTEEPDPLAAVTARLDALAQQFGRFADFDPQDFKRTVGQIRALQSKVDSGPSADSLKTLSARLDLFEETTGVLTDAVADSEYVDDRSKASIAAAKQRLFQSKTESEWQRREQELLSKVAAAAPATEPVEEPTAPVQSAEVAAATSQVMGYAEAKGVDPASIPAAAWRLQAGETLAQATTRVKREVDGLAAGDSAATRTATRRQAAGTGSPSRAGAAVNDVQDFSDAQAKYAAGEISHEQYTKYREQFGVSRAPGGSR